MSYAIVVSRFNVRITSRLLKSCLATLKSRGVPSKEVEVARVPGAYEIPWAAQELAMSGRFDVVISLGAVLRGETAQNDYISRSTIARLHEISLKTRVPCILGVITPDTMTQALARTRGSLDRGREAALAAVDMVKLRRRLNGSA